MVNFIQNRQELEQQLVIMKSQDGWSIRALARHFAVSRNLVRRVLRKHEKLRDQGHDILLTDRQGKKTERASKLNAYEEPLKRLLEKYPRITGQRLFEELRQDGYDGGISILRDRLRSLRPSPKKTPVIRFETEAGLQGQMDWSPYTIKFLKTGQAQVQCFSYILGFSRRHFIDFTPRRDFFTLIRRHQDAFSYFTGTPAQCLYDSEKTVVLRWEAGRAVINPAFSAFITHYRIRPIICRRGRAETKGKIERPFQYVEGNLLCGREFQDLDDLRACARWWMREKSDRHRHDTTGQPPLELFLEQERSALTPLPLHSYDCAEVALRVCDLEGYIEFETNRYPVPYEHVADILTMKATEHEILIYSPELDLIVRHEREPAGARLSLPGAAVHGGKMIRYGLEPVREQFLDLGDDAGQFLRGLQLTQAKNPGFHARYILHLKERYHSDDINRALAHAGRYHAYDCKAVERILATKATPRTLEAIRNERAKEQLRAALPTINQRSLADYSVLFTPPNHQEDTPHENTGHQDQDQYLSQNTEAQSDGALDQELARALKEASPPSELLERLLALEVDSLTERRIERRIRESKLPERKLLADFDFVFQKGLDKRQIMELATLEFASRKQGVIIAGTSGAGKSHIAKALLLIGCQRTFRCRYVTATTMLRELLASLADNTLQQKLKRFLSPEILLIDEVGFDRLEQHDPRNANLFHKVIDGRYCKGSTILTTNIDFKELGDYLGDPVITTATVDRMIHHSIIINIDGPSWRLHESKQLNARK